GSAGADVSVSLPARVAAPETIFAAANPSSIAPEFFRGHTPDFAASAAAALNHRVFVNVGTNPTIAEMMVSPFAPNRRRHVQALAEILDFSERADREAE